MCGYCIEANIVIDRLWRNGVLTQAVSEPVTGDEADWILQQLLLEIPDVTTLSQHWLPQLTCLYPELLNLRRQEHNACNQALADILVDCSAAAMYFSAEPSQSDALEQGTHHSLQQAFYVDFNRFWLALHRLMQIQPEHKILVDIAVATPVFVPDFPAYELALQRKLLCHCVNYYGMEFVAAYLQQLRPELIGYLADRVLYQPDELTYLLQLMTHWQGDEVLASKQDVIDHLSDKLACHH